MLPLSSKGTILGVITRTPIDKELQTFPHVTCLLPHQWDPYNVRIPNRSRTVEVEISSSIGAVMTEGGSPDLANTDSDSNSVYQIYDISAMTSLMIDSFKAALVPLRDVSETKQTVQDVPQAKIFQSKERHSTAQPEELSERWQIGLKKERDKITKTTQRLTL